MVTPLKRNNQLHNIESGYYVHQMDPLVNKLSGFWPAGKLASEVNVKCHDAPYELWPTARSAPMLIQGRRPVGGGVQLRARCQQKSDENPQKQNREKTDGFKNDFVFFAQNTPKIIVEP